ncbi:HAD-IIIA family hydrolase [Vineibacter terrae]|uniref:D,D-heptose 1,7-bisphosphate phosphatase n=1 Tax=Vineibacter terrae TaxID=2586908 RepID=A0A5C8PCU9_9HYPH|nr:HAD-IIIA family hydrolase [Vineibacter terrae]TXL71326.1 HAD-IIIA family hydrolase [Vineibacter terrae]
MARLVLLDRDGVINADRPDSVRNPGDLILLPGAAAAVARLNAAGVRVAVVTNQSVVGRGIISMAMLDRIHVELRTLLARDGAHLDALLACTDAPDRPSPRRKPRPGMLLEALQQFRATADDTPMIGDDLRDLQAAHAAGCRRVLVRTGKGAAVQAAGVPADLLPVAVRADLATAVDSYLNGDLW